MSSVVPLRSITDPATAAARALEKLITELESGRLVGAGPDALSIAVNGARVFWGTFPAPAQDRATAAIVRLTGRNPEWVRRLFTLSELEVRRALRSQPPKLDRHGYESVYPAAGWLGAYLLYAQDSEAPLGWHFWCAVAILGMVARRNFYWDRGRYILYLNHYLMMIGPTGLKKSTTIDTAVAALKLATQKAIDGARSSAPDPFYFSPEQVTPEWLDADLAAWYKAHPDTKDTIAAIINDEVVTLLGEDAWGAARIIRFLTAAYMGKESAVFGSIGRGKRELRNLQITCLFGTAPDWIRDSVTDEMLTGGFIGRCIMVPRDEPHGVYSEPPPADPVMKHILAESLVPWIGYEGLIECQRTPEATAWFDEWYAAHKGTKPADPRLEGWWNRKDDHLHKLAALLRLADLVGPDHAAFEEAQASHVLPVSLTYFQQAVAILGDEEARLPKLIAMVGASMDARNCERLLAHVEEWYRTRTTPMPHHLLMRKASHFLGDAWHFDRAMMTLQQQQLVRIAALGIGDHRKGRTYLPAWAAGDSEPAPPGA